MESELTNQSNPRIIDEAHKIKAKLQRMRPDQRRKALVSLKRTDPLMAKVVGIISGNGPHASAAGLLRPAVAKLLGDVE